VAARKNSRGSGPLPRSPPAVRLSNQGSDDSTDSQKSRANNDAIREETYPTRNHPLLIDAEGKQGSWRRHRYCCCDKAESVEHCFLRLGIAPVGSLGCDPALLTAERSAKLPGPPSRTLKLGKPGWRPRSASAVCSATSLSPT
jgi:hypothetical protein